MTKPDLLAIFDNDGTICDTQTVEGGCYEQAIASVTGMTLATLDWTQYEEPTSTAIVRDLLTGDPAAGEKEAGIEQEFLRLLMEAQPRFPGDFSPLPGAIKFIAHLRNENICQVAIATGCFSSTARFKLQCCGLALEEFPHATSSDTPRRQDILRLAAARAGYDISAAIYFADAPWDIRASQALGIPMIGIGRRSERLRSLGMRHVFPDFTEAEAILAALRECRGSSDSQGKG